MVRGAVRHLQPSSMSVNRATVARDSHVRICDAREGLSETVRGRDAIYNPRQLGVRVLKCHTRATKRIVTEDSPDLFLTVSEVRRPERVSVHDSSLPSPQDGTVRQHDLRVPHICGRGICPAPLVKVAFDLSSISLSPLTPYQFVVAGESPYVSKSSSI